MNMSALSKAARSAGLLAAVFAIGQLASAAIVADWQFNTPGDTEGWTASGFHVAGFKVANAVSGSEIVLTADNLQNQTDSKLYSPTGALTLSPGATAWETYTIRIRQLGTDNITPVPFDVSGTIAMLGGGAIPTLNPIHNATNLGYGNAPVTVTHQADQWNVVSYDISAYSGDINGGFRMDPIAGTDAGGGVVQGMFEIDYITITDNSVIPEPSSILLLGLGALAMLGLRRRNPKRN